MSDLKISPAAVNADRSQDKRRSLRVHIAVPIMVRGQVSGHAFEESVTTVTVSKHGCLAMLEAKVGRGELVTITNITTGQEAVCTVSYTGARDHGLAEVAAEFLKPADFFWRIVFPPDNGDPTERKAIVAPKIAARPRK